MESSETHDAKDTINKKKVFKNGLQEFSFKTDQSRFIVRLRKCLEYVCLAANCLPNTIPIPTDKSSSSLSQRNCF